MYILSIIRKTLEVLKSYSFAKYLSLQLFYLISAVVQVLGVASIAPFIGILSNPNLIESNEYLFFMFNYLGYENKTDFIVLIAIVTMSLIVISNIISGITLWLTFRFSVGIGLKVQSDLFKNYLYRGYLFHKKNNYNETIALIEHETKRFIYLVMMQFLLLTSHVLVSIMIIGVLLFVDYSIAISSALIVGTAYLGIYVYLKKFYTKHGEIVMHRNKNVQSILSESFIGIKDMKIRSLEDKYLCQFGAVNKKGLSSESLIALAGDIPKLVVESITFSALLMFAIIMLNSNHSTDHIVGILSLYAVAGYKLLPSMQQIYKAMSNMSANGIAASRVLTVLHEPTEKRVKSIPLDIKRIETLEMLNASFSYPGDDNLVLKGLNVKFKIGTINTIVGPSGSGKTTLIDILIGLIPLKSGDLCVNGKILSRDEIQRLKFSVSYVPQNIYMSNDDVLSNVAFGVDKAKINVNRVNKALIDANAIDFVTRLPQALNTNLGQNGQMLSGGQRQRIGIARALYHDTPILLLDEPTSALDIESEYEIIRVLQKIKEDKLIIIISHRPAAIKKSGNIIFIKDGQIIDQGAYEDLISANNTFKALMDMSKVD